MNSYASWGVFGWNWAFVVVNSLQNKAGVTHVLSLEYSSVYNEVSFVAMAYDESLNV